MFSGKENPKGKANMNIEKLFFQLFDRKRQTVAKIKQQVELYDQELASECILAGVAPPPWLWSPSQPSQTSELNKEEIISGLLFPQSGPSIRENQRVEKKPLDATSSPGRSSQGKMVQDETEPNTCLDPGYSSLAKIQRSKARQKALVLRSSSAKASKSCSNSRNDLKPSSPGGNIGLGIASLRSDSVSEIQLSKHDENDEGCRDEVENSNSQESRFSPFPTMSLDHRDSDRKRSRSQSDYNENSGSKRKYRGNDNRESLIIDRDDTVSAKVDEQVDDHPQSRSCNETAYIDGGAGSEILRQDSSNREHKKSSNSVSGTGDRTGLGVSAGGVYSSSGSLFGSGNNAPALPADTLPAVNAAPSPKPVAVQLVNAVTMSSDHRDSHRKRSRPHSDYDENGGCKRNCGDDNRDSLVIDRDDTVSAKVDEQVDDPQSRNCNETPDPSWLSHESKSPCQDSIQREHKKSSNSVSGTGDRMGHGVSAGGGKSSLGYLFGSGEAPNNAQAETMHVVNADPSPKPSGINSSSANNFLTQDSASIKKHLVSEFIPVDDCPVGTQLTESPDQVLCSEEKNSNPPENAETQLLIPEENDAAVSHESKSPCQDSIQREHKKSSNSVSGTGDRLGHGVSAGGGKSSLGYLFGSGEAPNNAQAETMHVVNADPSPKPSGIDSSSANNILTQDSASIKKHLVSEFIPIDDCPVGTQLTESPDQVIRSEEKNNNPPENAETQLLIPEENDAAAPTTPKEELGLDTQPNNAKTPFLLSNDELLNAVSHKTTAEWERYSVSDSPEMTTYTEMAGYSHLAESLLLESNHMNEMDVSSSQSIEKIDEEVSAKVDDPQSNDRAFYLDGKLELDPQSISTELFEGMFSSQNLEEATSSDCLLFSGSGSFAADARRNPRTSSPTEKLWYRILQKSSSSEKQRGSKTPDLPRISEEENENNIDEEEEVEAEKLCSIPPDSLPCIAEEEIDEAKIRLVDKEEENGKNIEDEKCQVVVSEEDPCTAFILSPTCNTNNNVKRKKNASCSSRGRNVKPPPSNSRRFLSKGNSLSSSTTTLGGLRLPVKATPTRHNNNIVTNITSFVPLVQQQQKPLITGAKRDVKVKALEAAEATRRVAEQKENERKMKKEAMKLEMEKKKKKEEEEARRRKTELANKQKEEMRKKRKDVELTAQDKNKKQKRHHKEEEEKTKLKEEAKTQQQEREAMVIQESYDISPYKCSDDEDDDDDDTSNKKFVPAWASKSNILLSVISQEENLDPTVIFPLQTTFPV